MAHRVNRRLFLKQSALAGALVLVGPGLAKTYAQNNKLNFAFVGVGGRGGAHLGMGEEENCVALCDVDLNPVNEAKKKFPDAKVYQDYRKLFGEMAKQIDAVVVATPDHHHAPAAMRAMALGKHVYCEKPLTWSIHEAREMANMARKMKVATQMGNQGHAGDGNRRVVEWVNDGAIGTVREIHTWTNRPVWPQGYAKLPEKEAVPDTLNWEGWIGPGPARERYKNMHGFAWRGWLDYGTGTIGDMGCHTWDSVWWSMNPGAPLSCELVKSNNRNELTHPSNQILKWEFGPTSKRPGFAAFWHDGGWKPPVPDEIKNDPARSKKELPDSASLYIGTKGKMLVEGDYGDSPRLIPEEAMKAYKQPERMESSPGHHKEFLMAAKGEKPWDYPKSNFTYGGPLVEAMLLGIVAMRAGEKVKWDPKNLRITNSPKANRFIRRVYRKGWELI